MYLQRSHSFKQSEVGILDELSRFQRCDDISDDGLQLGRQ